MSLEGGSDEDPLYASADEVLQNSASAKSKVEFSYEDISLLTSNSDSCGDDLDSGSVAPSPSEPAGGSTSSPAKSMVLNNSEDIYAVIDKSRKSPEKTLEKKEEEEPVLPELSSPADHLKSMESSLINLADKTIKSLSINGGGGAGDTVPYNHPEQPIKFSVHSIGWAEMTESDLQDQETSCRSINRCIMDLSSGKANDGTAWHTEGKELSLEIDGKELCLVDPVSTTVLSVQPIHTIRVWGVGSQNTCDFAYVARDPVTRMHKCHVFRCEVPAKHVANTLKEICSRLAKERKNKTPSPDKPNDSSLHALELIAEKGKVVLPAAMNASSKTKKCHYLGSTQTHKHSGMDVVNAAIDKVYRSTNRDDWLLTNVTVSSADIRVVNIDDEKDIKLDTRLRFLTFFGISAEDVKLMGTIVHTAEDEFVVHVFHCEPSAGALCKVIEAACKLRYQKLLDSMPEKKPAVSNLSPTTTGNKSIQQTVKSVLSRVWSGRKS
ncbi:hypothetical protein EB796_002317 [Bugula neritina]|uniref:PID domain-containing protein n=1 Tax=Bugula neritina TaxID=10212 RepID=A0A7J7KMI2_BUGNE|nr:hypothetical protein EB796_002317 [Bugula neritina]